MSAYREEAMSFPAQPQQGYCIMSIARAQQKKKTKKKTHSQKK